jgi:transposase InsO family protein
MAAENLPVKLTCRILGVSVSGYYDWRTRAPSARDLRHAQLTSLIRQIHTDARGVYGARRVHAELTLGRGIAVGRESVEMLMRRAGLQGLSGRRSYRHVPNTPTASDLVDRKFERSGRDQLWVTDITEHFEYLEIFHNRQRRHSMLGMLTPVEYETRRESETAA